MENILETLKMLTAKKMSDFYLCLKLEQLYPGFRQLYNNTIGFIHFSCEHIKFNNDFLEKQDKFQMYIRLSETTEINLISKVDFAFNMSNVGTILFRQLNGYKLHLEELIKTKSQNA